MASAPIPHDEALRIETLRSYAILDSGPERAFDSITRYVAKQFDAQISVVSLVDTDRQWFKSGCGLDASETPRDQAFCAYTILDRQVNYIPDATQDMRTRDNPLVTGEPHIRFYCGAPLIAPNGQIVGSLCVIDSRPRPDFSKADQSLLQDMAGMVVEQMEMRKAAGNIAEEIETRVRAEARAVQSDSNLGAFVDHVPVAIALIDRDGRYHARSNRYLDLQQALFAPDAQDNFIKAVCVRDDWCEAFETVLTGQTVMREEDRLEFQDGRNEYAKWELKPWCSPSGEVLGAVLSVVKISEQVDARLETERQNEMFKAVLENVEDGIVACDHTGRLTLFNHKTRIMHGIDIVELPIEECGDYYSLYEEDGHTPLGPDRVPLFRALKGERVVDQSMIIAPQGMRKRDIIAQASQLRRQDGTIMGAVASMADVTEAKLATRKLKASQKRAVHLAYHDTLTGLANRANFSERFGKDKTLTPDAPVAALFIDLNRFKSVNDTLGHKVGDDLLVRVANILSDVVAEEAFVARFGGDEFVVVTHVTDTSQALSIGREIIQRLDTPVSISGNTVVTGASIGIAVSPSHGDTVSALVRRADIAMYRGKAEEEREPVMFEPVFELNTVERTMLESELKQAIVKDELRVFFQPIVSGCDHRMQGVEALVRWQHPRLGLIGADRFISIAEESGFIIAMGEWVLETALSHFASHPDMFVSVNISPVQFRDPELVTKILATLQRTGFDPNNLELEITESLLINDAAVARRVIDRLKAKGIRIALDDFGTGYSSLSYLQQIPFNKIKIDRSFVKQLGSSPQSEAVVRCVVELASALGMIVTAEGVETAQHEAMLKQIGCQTLQGYKYGRPQPFDALMTQGGRDLAARPSALASRA